MNLSRKSYFYLLVMLTGLMSLTTIKIAAMEDPEPSTAGIPVDPFAPLRALITNSINANTLDQAFRNTFYLMCVRIVQLQNPIESKYWLESTSTEVEINKLVVHLKERINHQMNRRGHFTSFAHHPALHFEKRHGFAAYDLYVFRALEEEAQQLHKKRTALIKLLEEAGRHQIAPYLYDAKLLQETAEHEISCWATTIKSCVAIKDCLKNCIETAICRR